MMDSETSREINVKTSSIVRIAYHQLSIMCGTRDPTAPTSVVAKNADVANARGNMRRLLETLPVSVSSAFRNAYAVTKDSHESVAAILNSAENGVRVGWEFASPVTGWIADVLESPFNAMCVGLDFVEERIPPVYASMKDGVRNMFTSALETFRILFGGTKNQIKDLAIASETAQEKIRKVSS